MTFVHGGQFGGYDSQAPGAASPIEHRSVPPFTPGEHAVDGYAGSGRERVRADGMNDAQRSEVSKHIVPQHCFLGIRNRTMRHRD